MLERARARTQVHVNRLLQLIFTCVEHWAIIKSVNLWLEQSLIKEKNESPDDDIHVSRERNCPLGHFPCLGKLSLSLISVQKDCLISLRSIRHHSFFSTIAESESSSRGMKSSSSFAFSHCTHVCHHGGTIILPFLWNPSHCVPGRAKWSKRVLKLLVWIFMLSCLCLNPRKKFSKI